MFRKRFSLKHLVSLLLILLAATAAAGAQCRVELRFSVPEGSPALSDGELFVQRADSIVYYSQVSGAATDLELAGGREYTFALGSIDFEPWRMTAFVKADTVINVALTERATELEGITVEGYARPKVTATGEVYRLSKAARECGDPFSALAEIPILEVNLASQEVTVQGNTALILINGRIVNSGIAPIDPKFIESVKVEEVVSAKYLNMGVSKIIDIRLKRDVRLYTYVDLRTRHDILPRYGFEAANFEVGTPKLSVTGSLNSTYLHNDRTLSDVKEAFAGEEKDYSVRNVNNNLGWNFMAMLKWEPDTMNYFSTYFDYTDTHSKLKGTSEGRYTIEDSPLAYTARSTGRNVNDSWVLTGFHQHTFRDKRLLSNFLSYNHGKANNEERTTESYGPVEDLYQAWQESLTDTYNYDIDFDDNDTRPYGYLTAGNSFMYSTKRDYNLTQTPSPTARVALTSNYTYASYYNNWKDLNFMVSAGLQYMHTNTPGGSNSWWRPRAAASLTQSFLSTMQFLRLSYKLTNQLPSLGQLYTFNSSTNPWLGVEGNPLLTPMEKHSLSLSYDKYLNRFQFRASAEGGINTNMIESYIRDEGDMAVRTYRNNGSFKWAEFSLDASYGSPRLTVSLSAGHNLEHYQGMATRPSFQASWYVRYRLRKFQMQSSMRWRNRAYSPESVTEYKNPLAASIDFFWQPINSLQIGVGMPYFWGVREYVSTRRSEEYYSRTKVRFKSSSLRPWLLISWTIRKNADRALNDRNEKNRIKD